MPFSVYVTDDGPGPGGAPVLITSSDRIVPIAHPEGKAWRWAFTSTESPQTVLVGRRLVRMLRTHGEVISDLPLDQLLQARPVLGAMPGPRRAPKIRGR